MYNNNTINEGYKTLSPEAQNNPVLVEKYNKLVDDVNQEEMYEDFTEEEINELIESVEAKYYQLHPDEMVLNEMEWWTVSPFYWLSGFKVPNIFKPIKWLAGLMLAGLGLLFAGLLKALKEGKKQIAIAKVRRWIQSLVVTADGGYKKARKSKDSLFLIQARARRDVLQAAVQAGYAAGLNIPEKNTQPMGVESAKNEAWTPILDKSLLLFEDTSVNPNPQAQPQAAPAPQPQPAPQAQAPAASAQTQAPAAPAQAQAQAQAGTQQAQGQTGARANTNPPSNLQVRYSNQIYDFSKPEEAKKLQDALTANNETFENAKQIEINTSGKQNDFHQIAPGQPRNSFTNEFNQTLQYLEEHPETAQTDELNSTENIENENYNPSEIDYFMFNNVKYEKSEEGLRQMTQAIQQSGANLQNAEIYVYFNNGRQPEQADEGIKSWINETLNQFNSNASQELNDKLNASYKPEEILPDDTQVDWSLLKTIKTSKFFGLVKHSTNLWAEAKSAKKYDLTEIQDETDRQKYITNMLMTVNASLSKITTPNIARNYSNVINQFVQKIMQRDSTGNNKMMSINGGAARTGVNVGNHGGSTYESNKYYKLFKDDIAIFEANNNRDDYYRGRGNYYDDEYTDFRRDQQQRNSELDYDSTKNLIDNTFKASQNIFTATPVSEFLIFTKTRDQMNNFLNELTKSVHVIINSVAKKAAENSNTPKGLMAILADKGDPKQNRSLTNLWDNIARPKLDSREITRLFALTQSPEFVYFVEMLTVSIPLCIMTLFTDNNEQGQKTLALISKDGKQFKPYETLKNASEKERANEQGKIQVPNEALMDDLFDDFDGTQDKTQDNSNGNQQNNSEETTQEQTQDSSLNNVNNNSSNESYTNQDTVEMMLNL